jgi:serine/threonine-protein kinase
MLYAAALVVVGASVAVPAVLLVGAEREPAMTRDGALDAGVAQVVQAQPVALASAHNAPGEGEDAGHANANANAVAPKASASAEASGPGFFTIRTTPSARVTDRGRVLCTSTPCAKLPLAPGVHTITLENREESLKNVISVTIVSGEITSKRVTLK